MGSGRDWLNSARPGLIHLSSRQHQSVAHCCVSLDASRQGLREALHAIGIKLSVWPWYGVISGVLERCLPHHICVTHPHPGRPPPQRGGKSMRHFAITETCGIYRTAALPPGCGGGRAGFEGGGLAQPCNGVRGTSHTTNRLKYNAKRLT